MKRFFTLMGIIALQLTSGVCSSAADKQSSPYQQLTMTFEFSDECDDRLSPEIEFYLKENPDKFWGTYWLQYFNEPLKTRIKCEKESHICFGAWLDQGVWGCGKKCAEPSKGACYLCQEITVSIGLQCNK